MTFVTQKKRFEERLDREIEAEREFYDKQQEKLAEQTKAKGSCQTGNHKDELFTETFEMVDPEEELSEKDTVYVITPDEYGANGYQESQLYYYAADETLTDSDDNVIEPDETTIGDNALDFFVYTDAGNCYVRNTETKTDYEIVRVEGSFASYESEGLYE